MRAAHPFQLTVKFVALIPEPPGVVTPILPVIAPVGTVAVICVTEFTVNCVAATPPKVTLVAPVSAVPVMVTDVPTAPLAGENPVTVGAIFRLPSALICPVGVVTDTTPVIAVGGITAVMKSAPTTLKLAAGTDPKLTAVLPVKPLPKMLMVDPDLPE